MQKKYTINWLKFIPGVLSILIAIVLVYAVICHLNIMFNNGLHGQIADWNLLAKIIRG